ncbi:OsmC family protein [Methylobacterium sp. W2]|uniref:OsmC family protein n=1 Tax=Methylobacterium sp. W2 TaxID=2598107 RepID=UPI001D0C4660|nr:OsmC family protein [Methylobacterium sp. W2]MCC0806827.1 OsmC family protein [Methylobacterium sp. W2]
MSSSSVTEIVQTFETIDRDALETLSEKGRSDPTAVRTVRARTIAQGRRFRHLNYVRNLDAHIVDEPPGLLGDDTAPNPTEALLAALGTCVAVGLQANAVARGWTVRGIEIESEGDINITSVWGTGDLSPKVVGLSAVRLSARLDIEGASQAELDELVAHAGQWSPVLNTVKNPVTVSLVRAR